MWRERRLPKQCVGLILKVPLILCAAAISLTLMVGDSTAEAQGSIRPDLVVTSISTDPTDPSSGDIVKFSAVVENRGEAPTPEGIVLGGVFKLNGVAVAYTATHKSSLASGGSVKLVSNGGGASGNGTWKAQNGSYTLSFMVDDVNRIAESSENNNSSDNSFNVGQVQGKPAKSADSFVNSMGVGVHMNYFDTVYNDQALIKEKLSKLGIRYVRTGMVKSNDEAFNREVYKRIREIGTLGIKFNLVVDPRRQNLDKVDSSKISYAASMTGEALGSFEGPNELDISGNSNWASDLRAYQKTLYTTIKNNPSTRNVPVLAPPLAHAYNAGALGDLSAYMDYGNMHPYPGGKFPGSPSLDSYNITNTKKVSGGKPIIATESGYHNGLRSTVGQPGVSEAASSKYLPRMFFENFNRGIERTYDYELINVKPDPSGTDLERNFGLLRNDGTEKPAFATLKNTIELLEDPGPRFETRPFDYELGGDKVNVHRTLLQKRDGSFYLVLWQEASSYDLQAKRDIPVPTRRVTVTLNEPLAQATTYLPNKSPDPAKRYTAPKLLTLDVPDHPLIVKLTPKGGNVDSVAPSISRPRPVPGSIVKDRTPTVRAKVRDVQTNLAKNNIQLYLDGRRRNFTYNRSTDQLKFTPRLAFGRHRVKIVARDRVGLVGRRSWSFRAVR